MAEQRAADEGKPEAQAVRAADKLMQKSRAFLYAAAQAGHYGSAPYKTAPKGRERHVGR